MYITGFEVISSLKIFFLSEQDRYINEPINYYSRVYKVYSGLLGRVCAYYKKKTMQDYLL